MSRNTVAVAVVKQGKEFAMLKRLTEVWTFPSGKVEPGETVEAATLREAFEEAGLTVKIVADLGEREVGENHLHYRLCEVVSGDLTLREPDKFSEARWLSGDIVMQIGGQHLHRPILDCIYADRPRDFAPLPEIA
ncbi:MAG: hypothetical protein DI626_03405 [Micavibrio aeruginosavorus]|uniref:Nudix hydrolase domain-containing protein n=1 Tax=Micavibrio aeruginosavorus TaxID=349221 RepID=A0A2W5BX54_9BACT|nr:MAG: hypothetical protein DI626_03405 [Micavibrio aeruginosavorus]